MVTRNKQWWFGILLTTMMLMMSRTGVAASAPLRGSKQQNHQQQQKERQRRLKQNPETPAPTTEMTTAAPTSTPMTMTSPPTLAPIGPPQEVPTSTPPPPVMATANPTGTPTAPLALNTRRLLPFSLKVEGDLGDESVFRRDLELYLLQRMKETVSEIQLIDLETAPPRRRRLQQATLLEYQGIATLVGNDSIFIGVATNEDVQIAQIAALEDTQELQDFLMESSTQPLIVLQVQVGDRDAISMESPIDEPDDPIDQGKSNKVGGIVVGVLFALLIIGGVVGFLVYREWDKPPPPPPYELEIISECDTEEKFPKVDDSLPMDTRIIEGSSMEEYPNQEHYQVKQFLPSAQKSLYSDPIVPMNRVSLQDAQQGMEMIQGSSSYEGMEIVNVSSYDPVIDLTKPAMHTQGIQVVDKEVPKPTRTIKIKNKTPPTEATVSTQQQRDLDNESAIVSIRSFVSGEDDDSMLGFSLAEASIESQSTTPPRFQMPKEEQQETSVSPNLQNNPQLRWFEQPQASKPDGTEGNYFSSDSESIVTLEEVSNPLRNSITGTEVEDLFEDDDKEDDYTEEEEDFYSSSKEDDSPKGESSIVSSSTTSDSDIFTSGPMDQAGALGYFSRDEDDEQDTSDEDDLLGDYTGLPLVVTPTSKASRGVQSDSYSDAPSDERNSSEQSLSGFQVPVIQKGLDHYTSNSNSNSNQPVMSPKRSFPTKTSTSPEFHPHIIPSNSWEKEPELVEHFLRERRRIKRAARKTRATRKQPPVTMEV